MKTVILCGGQGTRIRDVAEDIPKPMIPLGNLPILWHIMKYYAHWGHTKFILCLGYKGDSIRDFFLNYDSHTRDVTIRLGKHKSVRYHTALRESDWEVTLAETGRQVMTGSRIKRIQKYVSDADNFMLTYGDGLGDINLDRLVRFHRSHKKILTISGVHPPARFGELQNNSSKRVIEFNEKPQATAGRISGGYFVCRKELFKYLDDRDDVVFEQEPIKRLVKDRQVMVYEHDGFWQPMDTYRDYQYLNNLCEKEKAPWMIWR